MRTRTYEVVWGGRRETGVLTRFPHSTRHSAIKAKMNHEGREEHEGQASQHESLDSVFELGDVEVNE